MATITGSAGTDTLFGSAGNDLLQGLNGDDTLFSSAGNDTLDGGDGTDTADYSFETRALRVDLGLGRLSIGEKNDTLISIEALYGGKGDDTLIGRPGTSELLDGGGGDDFLIGQFLDTLLGSAGNDRFESNSLVLGPTVDYSRLDGPLRIDLEAGLVTGPNKRDVLVGIDMVTGSQGGDEMLPRFSSRTISTTLMFAGVRFDGAGGHDTLQGAGGDDELLGGAGNDLVLGMSGIDRLVGGPGDDTLDGGADGDIVSYSHVDGPVHVDLANGRASGEGHDVLRNIETVYGSQFNDLLQGDDGDNHLHGGRGDDTLEGGAGNDTLEGGSGNDVLRGGSGNDTLRFRFQDQLTIDGGAGSDTIFIGAATERDVTVFDLTSGRWRQDERETRVALTSVENALYAGKGSATIYGDERDNYLSADVVIGRGGNDTLEGTLADYSEESAARTLNHDGQAWLARAAGEVDLLRVRQLSLGSGNDQMLGAWVAAVSMDVVYGGAGNDRLVGTELHGGAGDDTLVGRDANYADSAGPVRVDMAAMTARGPDGNDTLVGIVRVVGSRFADTLTGGAADVFLDGGAGNDVIDGGDGNDVLVGRDGDDLLRGGAGNDELTGGVGRDTLEGGTGNDRLHAGRGQLQVDGGAGIDVLVVDWLARPAPEVNLREGSLRWSDENDQAFTGTVAGIEVVHNRSGNPIRLTGLDGPAWQRGETLIVGTNGSTMDGGSGIDMLDLDLARMDYLVSTNANSGLPERVRFADNVLAAKAGQTPDPLTVVHALQSVERLRFADSALAFGERALDVAKVAFALWSPAIAPSATLFGKGVDWYDQGHSYGELIDFALTYFTGLSDAQLAQTLTTNVKSTRSHSEVLNLITQQGRAAATQLVADDAANMAQVDLAGLKSNGITCALTFGTEQLFVIPG